MTPAPARDGLVADATPAGFRTSPQQRQWYAGPPAWAQLRLLVDDPDGVLDPARLAAAVRAVVARHEILRTSVVALAGHAAPVQVIGDAAAELVELTGASLDEVAAAERDLASCGLRASLVRPAAGPAALLLTVPAVLADRRSLRLVAAELAAAYDCGTGGTQAPVLQYADYAAWHNDLLQDEARAGHRAFWDGGLEAALRGPLPVVGARTAPIRPGAPGDWLVHRVRLDPEVTAAVRAMGERATLAAAWAVLLWRLGGERDTALGVTVAGRSYRELDGAVGPFAREVPVPVRLGAELPARAVVRQLRAALADAAAHADDLDPARVATAFPGGLSGFEHVPPARPLRTGGLTLLPDREDGRGGWPLTLRCGGGRLELAHDTRWLPAERATELLSRHATVLAAMTGAPDGPVGAVPLLLPGERARVLAAAQGPPPPAAAGRTLHELVREQSLRTPDAVAVQDGELRLTYAQLDALAGRFAGELAAAGVTPGRLVVLFLERGVPFLVALLAVLRAGAAFVPVDVRQPAKRLAFVLADTAAAALVAGPATAAPGDFDRPVLRCNINPGDVNPGDVNPGDVNPGDVNPGDIDPGDIDPGAPGADPVEVVGELAYVMYTSGSTGPPNGVRVGHGELLNYLLWAAQAYDLRAGTGALVHSSVAFDLTLTGLLAPLLVGQRVLLVPEQDGLAGLAAALRQERELSLLKLTPSQLDALLALLGQDGLHGRVRTLVLGGEQLAAESLRGLRGSPGGALQIVNEYGPTETVVGATAHRVRPDTPDTGPVPIGVPIAGARAYVLDAAMRPVPDSVPGELYLGGAGVAGGYLDRPELTAARFGADPFVPGGRLYRTGDRVLRDADGNLVFLGRLDEQLSLSGVRVEPGEVEAVLREHPAVALAAVAPSPGAGRLVACVVAADPPSADPASGAELAAFCRDRLPQHLVPTAFAVVAELPVTPNGKLDRAAVAELAAATPTRHVAPRTDTEEILAAAIAAVLGRDRVGIDDNYFVIGGDSIRSVMVASRVQARGLAVTVADLHRYPTVRELAAALASATGQPAQAEPRTEPFALVSPQDRAMMAAEVQDAFPLNLLQEGMIFHRDFAAKSAVYHAIASVRLHAPLDLQLMRTVLHELVRRHPMLRTSFDQSTYSRPLQLVHSQFRDPLSYEDLGGLAAAEQDARIDAWVQREKARGFELDEHPLIRFMVHRLDGESFQFTYGFHHEIVDGWSEALMVTEIFGHYFSVLFGEPIQLKPPATGMRDAVALELQALQRKENYDFWARYLRDATLMRLPRLDTGPAADTGARDIVRISVDVDAQLSDALKKLATAEAVPLKSVLLAAHLAVLNLYHGQRDTLTYTVTNGRPESADGSTAIGLFVNSLALRVRLGAGSWRELVLATLDSERRSLPYRRLPMAELKRHQGNEPLAETLFFFTDYHVFRELDRWRARGVRHLASELYGESTFPFCAIFRLDRESTQLQVRLEYDALQFPSRLMDELAGCYTRVLRAMAADPGARYDADSLLSAEQLHQVLAAGSAPAVPAQRPVPELIAAVARRSPDAVAVCDGQTALSYAALLRAAGRVAAVLARCGAGPERTVALLAERGPAAVIGLLGVLRAGAAYVPLDPSWPDERLRTVVRDAAPVAVLADLACAERANQIFAPQQPSESGGEPELAGLGLSVLALGGPAGAAMGPVSADSAAYVLYTSGSTGTPKGVVVSHGALASSTLARDRVYRQSPSRFLLLSPLASDSSVAGLFWPLCTGATLVLPPPGLHREPAALARHIERHAVTHTLGVPALLTTLLDAARPQPGAVHPLRGLHVLIAAGEACPRELHDDVTAALPAATLHNEYGPTENTVWSTVWSGRPPAHRPQLPIGRPVPGVRAHVLGWRRLPQPVGVPGELCLGGAGLARGYLGRPGLTAASFQPDPFGAEPGQRLYRSGDLARHTASGELEFLGRTDHQVKIRGFRVELGEIEGVLDAHPLVRRSVISAVSPAGPGEASLVAYVVPRPGASPSPQQLQQYLRERLPRYLVPADFVVLDALPLAATGKVDRSALPPPRRVNAGARSTPPGTETERLLAGLWCQALGVDGIGVHDDFFDLGGESLRAMQVVTRTNKVFGLELPVRSLFDAPTVAAFAVAVDQARASASPSVPG